MGRKTKWARRLAMLAAIFITTLLTSSAWANPRLKRFKITGVAADSIQNKRFPRVTIPAKRAASAESASVGRKPRFKRVNIAGALKRIRALSKRHKARPTAKSKRRGNVKRSKRVKRVKRKARNNKRSKRRDKSRKPRSKRRTKLRFR